MHGQKAICFSRDYHDEEWGIPEHDSRALWELLMLEGFQAGLAWITVLRKREASAKRSGNSIRKVAAFRRAGHYPAPRRSGNHSLSRQDRGDDSGARIYEEMETQR